MATAITFPFDAVIRLLFSKQHWWHVDGKRHKCTCCVTWSSWIVAFLYAGACGFIVGYVAINGLFTQDVSQEKSALGHNGTNGTANGTAGGTLSDIAAQLTTCKIEETADFAAEWAIMIATSLATWALATRPASITLGFFISRCRHKKQLESNTAEVGKNSAGTQHGLEMTAAKQREHSEDIEAGDGQVESCDNPMYREGSENEKKQKDGTTALVVASTPVSEVGTSREDTLEDPSISEEASSSS